MGRPKLQILCRKVERKCVSIFSFEHYENTRLELDLHLADAVPGKCETASLTRPRQIGAAKLKFAATILVKKIFSQWMLVHMLNSPTNMHDRRFTSTDLQFETGAA